MDIKISIIDICYANMAPIPKTLMVSLLINEKFNKNAKVKILIKKLRRSVRLIIIGPLQQLHIPAGTRSRQLHTPAAGLTTCVQSFGLVFSAPEPKTQVLFCCIVHLTSIICLSTIYIFNFFSRNTWWILMKLGNDEVLMVPYKCCCISPRVAQEVDPGRENVGHICHTLSLLGPHGFPPNTSILKSFMISKTLILRILV